ncbi:hypothetical protein [Mucisphaera calidilacus]|uniref:Uncharacterized protein n=1 Tax=Mucisphaera calidilacus TaxID=2527982 RepID=A0A518BUN8_9BACT|nr:hypothetical protein [Mucisphaera calidilacus]QDU70699.1 hypothetical protein Pan265_05300 [Mucisphaera calidilacus]
MLFPLILSADEATRGWRLGINDPSAEAWMIVGAYAVAGLLAGRAAMFTAGRESRFWWLIAAVMVGLGINKQLDLQSVFTETARDLSRAWGWVDYKRALQVAFIAMISGLMVAAGGYVVWQVRGLLWRVRFALLGLLMIGAFIVIKAASLHHVDVFLGRPLTPNNLLRLNVLFELPGILLVATGASLRHREAGCDSPSTPYPETRAREHS